MRGRALLSVALLLSACGCPGANGGAHAGAKLISVRLSVFGWNDARVGAILVDRSGRRTGWKVDRSIREIAGCILQSGSDEGIPDEAVTDTVEKSSATTPMYHYFTIQDSAGVRGLIHEGGCQLEIDPVVSGKVHLALLARGPGASSCKDTVSVWVTRGVALRWQLSWKVAGDSCAVGISRLAGKKAG